MDLFKRIINWILGLFSKSPTPVLDEKIKEKKEKIKELDKELDEKYTDVDKALEEWDD